MEMQQLSQMLQLMQQRVQTLYQTAHEMGELQDYRLLNQAFEELQIAMEEIHAIHEELARQSEELLDTQGSLDQERQRYWELFEFAPEGYIVTSLNGTIHRANRAAVTYLCTEPKFMTGRSMALFVPEGDRRAFRAQLRQVRDLERVQDWEVRLQPWKGAPFIAALTISVVHDSAGRPTTLRWLLRDITARKQKELDLLDRLEALERQVGDLTPRVDDPTLTRAICS